jgi:hypothetical protein
MTQTLEITWNGKTRCVSARSEPGMALRDPMKELV